MNRFLAFLMIFILLPFSCIAAPISDFPVINSGACILIDASTGQILYEKNSHNIYFPASITKIMTAVLTLEKCKLNDTATASSFAVNNIEPGSNHVGFVDGEVSTIKDLLYALMLNSANEVANILAEKVSGTQDEFAKLMTKRAKELGALNTSFITASGLHNKNHHTTAYDMAQITKYAMTIPEFREIVSTSKYKMAPTNKYLQVRYFVNSNKLIKKSDYYYSDAIGIKTGYTTKAGHTLVAGAKRNGLELICVVMNGKIEDGILQTYKDSTKLFEYTFDNYSKQIITYKDEPITEVPIKDAQSIKTLPLIANKEISLLARDKNSIPKYTRKLTVNENIMAPILKGQALGNIEYLLDGKTFGKAVLISPIEVKKNTLLNILSPLISGIKIISIFLACIAFLIIINTHRNRRRHRKYLRIRIKR